MKLLGFFKSLYLHQNVYYVLVGISFLFLVSFWLPAIYPFIWLLVFAFAIILLADASALYQSSNFKAKRNLPDKFSNADANTVVLWFQNKYKFRINAVVIDEIPVQFQKRDFKKSIRLEASEKKKTQYYLTPVERGEYFFGKLNCYITTPLSLIKRRYTFSKKQMVKVYPSFIQMRKYDFLAFDKKLTHSGLKKIRRIGHTMEFEQIKEYVQGDDIRTVNWKATAKHGELMVNQFQDEKSQPIYCLIDTGRVMQMPFENLSLLDYAINSSLAFANIALKKDDKIGMFTFSNQIGDFVNAQNKKTHLQRILNGLYNIQTKFMDSDFGLLYAGIQQKVKQRSLLLLYTNFEHIGALERQLPYLKAISKKHLLLVVFFENTEMEKLSEQEPKTLPEIYEKTIAGEFRQDKKKMLHLLQKHGIQAIFSKPKELSINTINKYLEIKARGLL